MNKKVRPVGRRCLVLGTSLLAVALLATGCLGHTQFTTARSMPAGDVELGMVVETGRDPAPAGNYHGVHNQAHPVTTYPWLRVGLGGGLEAGAKLMGLGGGVDLKMQFLGGGRREKWSLACDIGASHVYPYLPEPDLAEDETEGSSYAYGFSEGSFSIIGSWNFIKSMEWYFLARSAYRIDRFHQKFFPSGDEESASTSSEAYQYTLVGAATGLRIDFSRVMKKSWGPLLITEVQALWRIAGDAIPAGGQQTFLTYSIGLGFRL